MVGVVQLVRAPDCGSGGRGFEPHLPPQRQSGVLSGSAFFFVLFPPRSPLSALHSPLPTLRSPLPTLHPERHRHRASAGVAAGGAVDAYEAEVLLGEAQARLLLQLAHGAMLDGLVHLHESARQGPAALEGLAAAPHQQHLAPRAHHHTVGRQHRTGVIVCVRTFCSHNGWGLFWMQRYIFFPEWETFCIFAQLTSTV